jgi:hypothetical protein
VRCTGKNRPERMVPVGRSFYHAAAEPHNRCRSPSGRDYTARPTNSPVPWKSTRSRARSQPCRSVSTPCGAIFDYDVKCERLDEVVKELEQNDVWDNPERAQALGRERAMLEGDALELLLMAAEEGDEASVASIAREVDGYRAIAEDMEFKRMFPAKDANNCFLDIQAGAGGTEAQDWASMLLRMYLRWAESAGSRSSCWNSAMATSPASSRPHCSIEGEYAYGWLRTETGVHRLVRKSPFDSGNRRHTSVRLGVRVAGNRRQHRHRHQPGGPRRRRLPLLGRRRPARQQDRIGDPHHPHAVRHRRGLPDRAQPAQEPRPR